MKKNIFKSSQESKDRLLLRYGNFAVLRATVKTDMKVKDWGCFFLDNTFPLIEAQQLIDRGELEAREATIKEKEFCYHMLERTGKSACLIKELKYFKI